MTCSYVPPSVVGMNAQHAMPVRSLGSQGLTSSALGLGTMGMTMG